MTTTHKILRRPLAGFASIALIAGAPIAATTIALPAPALAQAGGSLDDAVAALRGIDTMRASFTQTDRSGQTVRGTMTLKRPGKIRFDEVNQVQCWPISNSPLGALLDPNRDVKKFGKLRNTGNPNVLSVEVRDPKKPEYGVITLIFVRKASAPGGWELTNWVSLDAQSNRTTVRLANQRYGMSVSDGTFTYKDPRRASRRPR